MTAGKSNPCHLCEGLGYINAGMFKAFTCYACEGQKVECVGKTIQLWPGQWIVKMIPRTLVALLEEPEPKKEPVENETLKIIKGLSDYLYKTRIGEPSTRWLIPIGPAIRNAFVRSGTYYCESRAWLLEDGQVEVNTWSVSGHNGDIYGEQEFRRLPTEGELKEIKEEMEGLYRNKALVKIQKEDEDAILKAQIARIVSPEVLFGSPDRPSYLD